MALITRRRGNHPAVTELRYAPDDTPYSYRECRKNLKQQAAVMTTGANVNAYAPARLAAQVDLLRAALETIRATWLDADGELDEQSKINQRAQDQSLARYALKLARQLDDDRTKARRAALEAHR